MTNILQAKMREIQAITPAGFTFILFLLIIADAIIFGLGYSGAISIGITRFGLWIIGLSIAVFYVFFTISLLWHIKNRKENIILNVVSLIIASWIMLVGMGTFLM